MRISWLVVVVAWLGAAGCQFDTTGVGNGTSDLADAAPTPPPPPPIDAGVAPPLPPDAMSLPQPPLPPPGTPGGFGADCHDALDCISGLCRDFDGERRCTYSCQHNPDCPMDAKCLSAGVCEP